MLIPPKSQLALDLAADETSVATAAEALHHAAATLRNIHAAFWARPTDRLLAALNADVSATLARFAANTAAGTAINAALDAADLRDANGTPSFPTRAPVTVGRADITFDGTAFVMVSPVPEPPAD